jgi:hypothetical protein
LVSISGQSQVSVSFRRLWMADQQLLPIVVAAYHRHLVLFGSSVVVSVGGEMGM